VRAWQWPALAMFTVGYGANHFVPLLEVYRETLGLSDAAATAIFGVYAVGLIPGLLLGGPASDRYGRRPLTLGFTAISLPATVVLISGQWGPLGLYAGRLLIGVVAGAVFATGSAWVKELSEDAPPGAGARRAAIALTAGFGIGPLVAGALAQWAPAPDVLPYVVHLALAAVALALLPRAPETLPVPMAGGAVRPRLRGPAASSLRFTRVVVPMAPWVFGSVTLVFTTLAAHGSGPVGGLTVAFPGALAALALAAGLAVQPLARRLDDGSTANGAAVGLAVVTVGVLSSAAATARPGAFAVVVAALLLGGGYGMCLVSGLREVERLARPDELAGLVAIYYALCYCGLAAPYLLALLAPQVGYPSALGLLALAAVLTLALVLVQGRRHPGLTRS
jgi:MFS family permease